MKRIFVTTQFEGLHCWPEAPQEVAFLRDKHRHVFKVRVEFEVKHNDRDLEFFEVQRLLNVRLASSPYDLLAKSCESIAEDIVVFFSIRGYPVFSCEVSEDGENGAIVFKEAIQ